MKSSEQKNFETAVGVFEALDNIGSKIPGSSIIAHTPNVEHAPERDWRKEAEWALKEQSPVKSRSLIYAILIAFAAVIGWTAFATVDEVVTGSGKTVTMSGTQIVQSIDGGIVEEILVKESQRVQKGDVLLKIDQTRYSSNLGERHAQIQSLSAKAARLEALTQGKEFVLPPSLGNEIPHIVANEFALYQSSVEEAKFALETAKDQLTQRRHELSEAGARLGQLNSAVSLALDEMEATKKLLASGAVSQLEVVRLDKEVARARGDVAQARAQAARARSAIEEAEGRIEEVRLRFINGWKNELSGALRERESLIEGNKALADRVMHSEIHAPMTGTIKRLFINSKGAVIMPGGTIAEVVAHEDDLAVEAQLSPTDRAFVKAGQRVVLKFTAFEYAIFGGIDGTVEYIGPDTVTDERGNSHYTIRIKPERISFGDNREILPGMVAQVDIITGKKTILEYITKPLFRAKEKALRER